MNSDLRLYSTFSGGVHTPTDLMALCAQAGLETVALTDRNTTAGVREAMAAAATHGITCVPAIEISVHLLPGRSTRRGTVLAYEINVEEPTLVDLLQRQARLALHFLSELHEDLVEMGLTVPDLEPGMTPEALALAVTADPSNAMFLGDGLRRPAELLRSFGNDRRHVEIMMATTVTRAAGGMAVMLGSEIANEVPIADYAKVVNVIPRLFAGGLECFGPGLTPEQSVALQAAATQEGLVITGGSGYAHPPVSPTDPKAPGDWQGSGLYQLSSRLSLS